MVVRARGALECDGSVGAGLVNLVVAVLEVRMGVTSRRRYELRRAVEHKIINYILKIKDFLLGNCLLYTSDAADE